MFAALPDAVNTPELRLELAEGEQHALISQLVSAARFPDAEISTVDGLRVDFDYGFGLARASNTTPTVIIRFEADDSTGLDSIQQAFRQLFNAVDPALELPF